MTAADHAAAPDLAAFEALALEALTTIPEDLRDFVADLVIRVSEFPDEETLDALDIDSPFGLLGLYRGVSLNHKSVMDPIPDLDMIFLYRRPILEYGRSTGADLPSVIRHVLIHEIGHHFGFSDDDMDRIGWQP